MYHSITFTSGDPKDIYLQDSAGKNTWEDWHLIPTSRPAFSMPSVKENFVEIPGANGFLDLTDILTGSPIFGSRTGSFDFIVDNDHESWEQLYSKIANWLHGKKLKAMQFSSTPEVCKHRRNYLAYNRGES